MNSTAHPIPALWNSREFIPDHRERAPYNLTGLRRMVFLALYTLIVSSSIGGLIYTFYARPLFGLMILPICYSFNNILFVLNHSRVHASFIELPDYRNICVFHETWLETRMSYFIDARAVFDQASRGFLIFI